MQVVNFLILEVYFKWLNEDLVEVMVFFKDLFISVMDFFRDKSVFDVLCEYVVLFFMVNRGFQDIIRVWVFGCVMGKEVYFLVILICESMVVNFDCLQVCIFVIDIDEFVLKVVCLVCYRDIEFKNVLKECKECFFYQDGLI